MPDSVVTGPRGSLQINQTKIPVISHSSGKIESK